MDRLRSSTQMIPPEHSHAIKDIFSGVLKQIQEELSSLDSSLPGSSTSSGSSNITSLTENLRVQSGLKEKPDRKISASSPASVKSTDLITEPERSSDKRQKNDNDDLKKTIRQVFSKFNSKKDQGETVENLTKSLTDAVCKHLLEKCQPEIQKMNEFTSSQVESILSCTSVASSALQVASSPMAESVLNQLVTFGKKVKNFTSSEGQPAVNTTLKKLLVQPFKNNTDLSVGKITVDEVSRDLRKVLHKVTDGSSKSPGSADLINLSGFHSRILEKVVRNVVSKMLMEKFNLPKSVFNEENVSNQESRRSSSPPLNLLQDMIVAKITENLFPTPAETKNSAMKESVRNVPPIQKADLRDEPRTAEALGAAGTSASKTPTKKSTGPPQDHYRAGTTVKEMIQVCALQAVKKTFTQ